MSVGKLLEDQSGSSTKTLRVSAGESLTSSNSSWTVSLSSANRLSPSSSRSDCKCASWYGINGYLVVLYPRSRLNVSPARAFPCEAWISFAWVRSCSSNRKNSLHPTMGGVNLRLWSLQSPESLKMRRRTCAVPRRVLCWSSTLLMALGFWASQPGNVSLLWLFTVVPASSLFNDDWYLPIFFELLVLNVLIAWHFDVNNYY